MKAAKPKGEPSKSPLILSLLVNIILWTPIVAGIWLVVGDSEEINTTLSAIQRMDTVMDEKISGQALGPGPYTIVREPDHDKVGDAQICLSVENDKCVDWEPISKNPLVYTTTSDYDPNTCEHINTTCHGFKCEETCEMDAE